MRLICARLLAMTCMLMVGAVAECAVAEGALAATTPLGRPLDAASSQVWIARRGWHIDLGLAVEALRGPLRSVAARFPAARYLFFGFGDRRYLTAKRHGSSTLAAALWPGAGLMLVTAIGGDPRQAFGERHALALTLQEDAMLSLQHFIWESFEAENQAARVIEQGPYEGSVYFAALPRYSGLHTCNTWAAEGLAAAQLPIRHRLVLLAVQLWSQAKKLERQGARTEPSLAGAGITGKAAVFRPDK